MAYKRISPMPEVEGGTNQTTYAAGDILYASASDTLSKLAKGSDTEVLTLASGLPSWAAGGGGGAWTYISTATASTSATIDFTGIDSTYNVYVITASYVIPTTDDTDMYFRIGTGGTPTYQSGASDYGWSFGGGTAAGSQGGGDIADSEIELVNNGTNNGLGTNTNESWSAIVYVFEPSNSSINTRLFYQVSYEDAGAREVALYGQGVYLATTAVTAFRFILSSSTIASGVFKLYGITGS